MPQLDAMYGLKLKLSTVYYMNDSIGYIYQKWPIPIFTKCHDNASNESHGYADVTWVPRRLNLPATRLLIQHRVQTNN